MREVARTVREAGIEPILSAPTAIRQDWAAARGRGAAAGRPDRGDLEALLDALLALPPPRGGVGRGMTAGRGAGAQMPPAGLQRQV